MFFFDVVIEEMIEYPIVNYLIKMLAMLLLAYEAV
jgi:hypothetical protein